METDYSDQAHGGLAESERRFSSHNGFDSDLDYRYDEVGQVTKATYVVDGQTQDVTVLSR